MCIRARTTGQCLKLLPYSCSSRHLTTATAIHTTPGPHSGWLPCNPPCKGSRGASRLESVGSRPAQIWTSSSHLYQRLTSPAPCVWAVCLQHEGRKSIFIVSI